MSDRAFTSGDICRILKASESSNVKSIEYHGLKILFQVEALSEAELETTTQTLAGQPKEPKEEPGELISNNDLQEIIEEIEQENFALTDPAGYERQILDERVYDRGDSGEPNGRGTEVRRP